MDENTIEGAVHPIKSRKLRTETCRKYDYRVAKVGGKIVHVANYRKNGNPVAQHVRFAEDKDFIWVGKSKGVELFGQHLFSSGGKRLVITEGEIDCLTISQSFGNKWPVVSIPSGINSAKKALTDNLEWVESYQEIVLAFDDDGPGREAVEECANLFSVGKVKVMTYAGYKDANDLLMANKGDQIAPCVFNAQVYRPDGIVMGTDLWEEIIKAPEPGLELPYPILQEKLQGLRAGRIHMFTAGSGIGKSTFVHELAYHLFTEHNQPIGVMALEESKKRTAERYLAMHLNKIIHTNRKEVSEEELREAYDSTINNHNFCLYDHWGSTDIDNLLSKIRYMVVGLGIRWLVLDHISIVVSGLDEIGESERKTIDKLMTRLRTLVNETGVGVLAIVHLKRKQGNGRSFNEGRAVSLTDLRGSASLEQLSDCIYSLERNQQKEDLKNFSQMRLLKDRDLGDTGLADVLQYFPTTGRMLTAEHNPFEDGGCPFPSDDGGDDF